MPPYSLGRPVFMLLVCEPGWKRLDFQPASFDTTVPGWERPFFQPDISEAEGRPLFKV